MSATKIINGKLYDENLSRRVGDAFTRETQAPGNIPGYCNTMTVRIQLMRRQRLDSGLGISEQFEKDNYGIHVRRDKLVDTDGYFLLVNVGYNSEMTRIEPLTDDQAYAWACEHLNPHGVFAEFAGRTDGDDYVAKYEEAKAYFEGLDKPEDSDK